MQPPCKVVLHLIFSESKQTKNNSKKLKNKDLAKTLILLRKPRKEEASLLQKAETIHTINEQWCDASSNCTLHPTLSDETYFQEAFQLIQNFPHKIYSGNSLLNEPNYKGKSLFYFTRFILINRFTPALKEYRLLEGILKKLSEEEKSKDVVVLNSSPYSHYIESKLRIDFITKGVMKAGKLNKKAYYMLFVLRAFLGFFINIFRSGTKHIFLFPQVEPQPLLHRETLKMESGNPITDYYLEDFLKKKGCFVLEERFPVNEGSFDLNRQNLLGRYGKRSLYFEPYLLKAILFNAKGAVLKNIAHQEKHIFDTINKHEANGAIKLLNHIQYDLRALRKLGVLRMMAAENLYQSRKIKTTGCIDEYSVKSRSVLYPAAISGSKTYAIQHGSIHKNHMGYSYLKEDKEHCKFVDQLFVYGQDIKNLLIAQNNFAGETIVSGQLRADIIPTLLKKHTQLKVEGLNDDRPMILYTSQPVFSVGGSEIRDAINRDFFALSKEFPDCKFVLKPHPRETDWTYFEKIAMEVGATDYLITQADLYLLLSKCTMMLTHCSSVGAEAVNFDKPLVVQDYPNIDIMDYIKDGIGFKASDKNELRKVISGILEGQLQLNEKAYANYRNRFSGPIDGQVCTRILNQVLD